MNTFKFMEMHTFTLKQEKLMQEIKLSYLDIFGLEFGKTIVIFDIIFFKFVELDTFMFKNKKQSWDKNCLNWVFLDCNLKKTIVIFEVSIIELVKMERFMQRKKPLSSGAKMLYLYYSQAIIWKKYCHI